MNLNIVYNFTCVFGLMICIWFFVYLFYKKTYSYDDGTSKLANKAGSKQMTQLAREAPGAAKPKAIKLEKAAPPAKSASPATKKPVQKTGDFSVNPTKPGKKTYSKKGAEATDLSDAALAEKLQSKF